MQYENALVLRLCLETGLRVGDAVSLRTTDLVKRTIHYTAQKTGKDGCKVITEKLAKELRRNACGGWIFPGRFGGHRTRQAVWADVKKAAKMCGLSENFTPHSARKTYAVNIFHDQGIEAAERELQHDRMDTTMLYVFSNLLNHTDRVDTDNSPITLSEPPKAEDIKIIADVIKQALREVLEEYGFKIRS